MPLELELPLELGEKLSVIPGRKSIFALGLAFKLLPRAAHSRGQANEPSLQPAPQRT